MDEKINKQKRWDTYFIDIANVVRSQSKDPSSQIGVVIVNDANTILSTGYNDFPWGIANSPERWDVREAKYKFVEHAERNAVYQAARFGHALDGATMYMVGFGPPTVPCINCAKAIIQSGIKEIRGWPYKVAAPAWAADLDFARELLVEAGINLVELNFE